jgi:hypothetical protein
MGCGGRYWLGDKDGMFETLLVVLHGSSALNTGWPLRTAQTASILSPEHINTGVGSNTPYLRSTWSPKLIVPGMGPSAV